MVILIISTKSQSSGALTILNEIIQEFNLNSFFKVKVLISHGTEIDNRIVDEIFIHKKRHNLILNLFHKYALVHSIITTNKIDYILSLENFVPLRFNIRTGVLIHNSLPYLNDISDLKFRMYSRTRLLGFYYQLFKNNIDDIYVQLDWFKDKLTEHIGEKEVTTVRTVFFNSEFKHIEFNSNRKFLYPASEYNYKNHKLIVEAITEEIIHDDFLIYFTVSEEFKAKVIKNHPFYSVLDKKIIATGYLNRSELIDLMRNTILLFPSKIECFPTPIAEAVKIGAPILAINKPYAVEFLKGYDNYDLFNNSFELASLLKKIINNGWNLQSSLFKSDANEYPSILEVIQGKVV